MLIVKVGFNILGISIFIMTFPKIELIILVVNNLEQKHVGYLNGLLGANLIGVVCPNRGNIAGGNSRGRNFNTRR